MKKETVWKELSNYIRGFSLQLADFLEENIIYFCSSRSPLLYALSVLQGLSVNLKKDICHHFYSWNESFLRVNGKLH